MGMGIQKTMETAMTMILLFIPEQLKYATMEWIMTADGLFDCDDSDCMLAPAPVLTAIMMGMGIQKNDGDCDDNDNTVYPGATEICNDVVDNDCDGLFDY